MSNSDQRTQVCVVCRSPAGETPSSEVREFVLCKLCFSAYYLDGESEDEYSEEELAEWELSHKLNPRSCIVCAVTAGGRESRPHALPDIAVELCVGCLGALLRKDERAKMSLRFQEKISFLQYDPSLSNDSRGNVSFLVEGIQGSTDECILAHRFVLMSKSPVFKAMMEIDMKEKITGIIRIEGMSAAVVRAAVNFMYRGEIEFDDKVLPEDVLRFAHQYDIELLKTECEEGLVRSLVTTESFAKMFFISDRFGLEILKEKAQEYFTNHPNDQETMLGSLLHYRLEKLAF